MILFDFLFYYLTMWFSTAKTQQISSPPERASYTLGIISSVYIMWFFSLTEYFVAKSFKFHINEWVYILIGFGLIQLYQYIYVNNGRYELIKNRENNDRRFRISDKRGMNLSIAFCIAGPLFFVVWKSIIHSING
jgi:hypothetical protein